MPKSKTKISFVYTSNWSDKHHFMQCKLYFLVSSFKENNWGHYVTSFTVNYLPVVISNKIKITQNSETLLLFLFEQKNQTPQKKISSLTKMLIQNVNKEHSLSCVPFPLSHYWPHVVPVWCHSFCVNWRDWSLNCYQHCSLVCNRKILQPLSHV